jgi:hypothetical protein
MLTSRSNPLPDALDLFQVIQIMNGQVSHELRNGQRPIRRVSANALPILPELEFQQVKVILPYRLEHFQNGVQIALLIAQVSRPPFLIEG